MMNKARLLVLIVLCTASMVVGRTPAPLAQPEIYGLWLHPGTVGHSNAEVAAYMEKAHNAHINTIVFLVKGDSWLYYASKRFPEAVSPAYRNFDVLQAVITEAHKRGMKVHAWLTDFVESAGGWAYQHHPEWAELNPDGKTTLAEMLGPNRPVSHVWMCPAQRPSYTDQYLLPMIREIVTHYDVDGIHHDYVRYPGDVNPDGYCFCDYCLEHIFTHAHLVYETEPSIPPLERLLPRLDADLSREYTPQPPHWGEWTRRDKANFLLYGRYQYDSAPDMSYFFYTYRTDAIREFVRESYEVVKSIRPNVVISAAVFKNPLTSGRFIGQRWTDWTEYVDEFMPMTYRSHFSVDWKTFLGEFGEYTRCQKKWVGKREFDQGIATTYLFREMQDPIKSMNAAIDRWAAHEGPGGADREDILRFSQTTLSQLPEGGRKDELMKALKDLPEAISSAEERKFVLNLRQINKRLLGDPPSGFFPPERLLESIRVAHENGADGIVLFAGDSIDSAHLWDAVRKGYERYAQAGPRGGAARPR